MMLLYSGYFLGHPVYCHWWRGFGEFGDLK